MLVGNELNKVKRVFSQLENMLRSSGQECKQELSSIKLLLELLISDREISKQEEDFDTNTAQFNESEAPKSLSEREDKRGIKA